MLDPRDLLTGFIPVALAVIVFASRSSDQRGTLGPTLAPDASMAGGPLAHEHVRRDLPGPTSRVRRPTPRWPRTSRGGRSIVQGGTPSRRTCSSPDRRRHAPHAGERGARPRSASAGTDASSSRTVTRSADGTSSGSPGQGLTLPPTCRLRRPGRARRVLAGSTSTARSFSPRRAARPGRPGRRSSAPARSRVRSVTPSWCLRGPHQPQRPSADHRAVVRRAAGRTDHAANGAGHARLAGCAAPASRPRSRASSRTSRSPVHAERAGPVRRFGGFRR